MYTGIITNNNLTIMIFMIFKLCKNRVITAYFTFRKTY